MENLPSDPAKTITVECLTYSIEESAVALGLSKPTIYRLISRGVLRPLPGLRHKRIPCVQVKRFGSGKPIYGLN